MPNQATFDSHQLAALVKQKARAVGFDLCGIASVEPSARADHFRAWLDAGKAGEMSYLANRFDERIDPRKYFPAARSAICVALNYFVEPKQSSNQSHDLKIASYARGLDYHEHVKDRLWMISDWLCELVPEVQTRCATDTAPIMERELAARAGIGWIGKNTMLIHPSVGSFTFLGTIFTSLELPIDEPMDDHCGTCTRCIDACPTQAIEPYTLDARRCISYLTIEHRTEIAPELKSKLSNWVFGCDICQDVCPHNRKVPISTLEETKPRVPSTISREKILDLTDDDFRAFTRKTSMRRVKLPQFKRNAR
ncbi:MAG TPA: tRNA epoxyqueuosine(34) reductase QueG [Tepidisphaeraceae bacterium]|nr:tRNA epoxyqueuosine(34) reductase QueG [Tepidisphaeraceae bacterium]